MKHIISWVLRNIPRKFIQLFAHRLIKIYSLFLKGDKVYCPVCDHKFSTFLPYGRLNPRQNALCPSCLSLERHRLMHLFLKTETDFYTSNPRVLHVAPEYCFIDRFEKHLGENYITADIESPLAKVKMDLHDIPFEDNTFDAIIMIAVIHHLDPAEHINVLSEISRVLKLHGRALITNWAVEQPTAQKTSTPRTFAPGLNMVLWKGKETAPLPYWIMDKTIADEFIKNLPQPLKALDLTWSAGNWEFWIQKRGQQSQSPITSESQDAHPAV